MKKRKSLFTLRHHLQSFSSIVALASSDEKEIFKSDGDGDESMMNSDSDLHCSPGIQEAREEIEKNMKNNIFPRSYSAFVTLLEIVAVVVERRHHHRRRGNFSREPFECGNPKVVEIIFSINEIEFHRCHQLRANSSRRLI